MNNLKAIRLQNNITQVELAKIVNVKQNTISNWESGRTEIDQKSLEIICDYFRVTSNKLLGISTPQKEQPQFSPEEIKLIEMYRKLDDGNKKMVFGYAENAVRAIRPMQKDVKYIG